ncbi:MAG: hypothetical protein ACFCUT_06690 [Kiloniellaceae bacterium]
MPEIVFPEEIGVEPGTPPTEETVARTLLAHLLWPRDEKQRDAYSACMDVFSVDETLKALEKALPAMYPDASPDVLAAAWATTKAEVSRRFFGILGVEGILSRASLSQGLPVMDAEANAKRGGWITAGAVLVIVRALHLHHRDEIGGASVGRAVDFLERHQRARVKELGKEAAGKIPRVDRELQRAWSDFKPVAHIAAAILTIYEAGNKAEQDLRVFLHQEAWNVVATARDFQDFAVGFQEKRSRSTLLDRPDTYSIPSHVGIGRGTAFPPPPLGEHLLHLAQKYEFRPRQ